MVCSVWCGCVVCCVWCGVSYLLFALSTACEQCACILLCLCLCSVPLSMVCSEQFGVQCAVSFWCGVLVSV